MEGDTKTKLAGNLNHFRFETKITINAREVLLKGKA